MGQEGWIALLAALVSGVVVRIVDRTYAKGERSFDDAVAIRKELRDEVRGMHDNLKALQTELDTWKERYFDLASRYQTLVVECQTLRGELQELKDHQDGRLYQQLAHLVAELKAPPPVGGTPP